MGSFVAWSITFPFKVIEVWEKTNELKSKEQKR
jgi:hypothetical protein